ncbi:MAG: hypothetical protein GWN71_30280 [Gammaproteobacteria bacterium]|nr:hypothetical protein [Gemmatimonadota bacterium]NIU77685.1 hypothetical protein [Gammaproteobacteria bacterium]
MLGREALPPPATFDFGVFVVALVAHFALSIVYAVILAWIVHRWRLGPALAAGAGYGLLLYLVNFYGFTAVFPWFAEARNAVSVFVHLVFGLVAALAYKALERTEPAAEVRP